MTLVLNKKYFKFSKTPSKNVCVEVIFNEISEVKVLGCVTWNFKLTFKEETLGEICKRYYNYK